MDFARFYRQVQNAARMGERSGLAVLLEMLRLRRGPGRVGPGEYIDFRLYEQDLSPAEKADFCGYAADLVLDDILIDEYSRILSLDKLTFYMLLRGNGLPTPEIRALYVPRSRGWPGTELTTPEALTRWLREEAVYPLYFKPANGILGQGNTSVAALEGDELRLGDGSLQLVETFCRSLPNVSEFGWLIQEALRSHPEMERAAGPRISSLRIVPTLNPDGPRLHRAVWKINAGDLDTDHFRAGASRNMAAEIDIASGRVARVVTGVGPTQQRVQRHPLTGVELEGFQLPLWAEVTAFVNQAAGLFPGFLCQGWDIALTTRGVTPLEVNIFGATNITHHAARRGFMDADFRAFLRGRGLEPYLTGPARPDQHNPTGRMGRRAEHWRY